jgi:hypothetical protein
MADRIAALRAAVEAQGLVPGAAKAKRGKPGVTLVWLRPEPVTLRIDAKDVLWLEAYLPWVMAGGKLHQRVKAFAAAQGTQCASRDGHVSIGMDGGPASLPALLAAAQGLRDMLQAEWPDYATGVFAKALT